MIRTLILAIAYLSFSFVSYPGINAGWVVWFSWIPLFYLLDNRPKVRSYCVTFLAVEWLKWILLVFWLRHVSWIACFGIAGMFALYHGIWFIFLRIATGESLLDGIRKMNPLWIVGFGLLWGAMELLRTQPFGLTGAHMCITQWEVPILLQSVSVIGGYGLSAIIVICNLLLIQLVVRLLSREQRFVLYRLNPGLIVASVLVGMVLFGANRLGSLEEDASDHTYAIRIGVVQPYAPAYLSWNYERMTNVIRTVFEESKKLVEAESVDLVVWPEGTLPGSIYTGSPMEIEVRTLVDYYLRVPLVFGNQSGPLGKMKNSVLACIPDVGVLDNHYSKRILVPFGEYIPFRKYLRRLETIVPIPEDFVAGEKMEVIPVPINGLYLNVGSLICYEDCFPGLLLNDDLHDVDLLFVATYNVWYGEEFGAYFHAAHSVLRAAEVARPVLRCGSAGWSGLIDGKGRIKKVVREASTGSIYFRGSSVVDWIPEAKIESTFYKSHHKSIHLFYCLIGLAACGYALKKSKSRKGIQ